MSFIEDARNKAMRADNVTDETVQDWANRAFACIAIAGGIDGAFSDDISDSLAEVLAKAPTEVLAGGTLFMMAAHAQANDLGL